MLLGEIGVGVGVGVVKGIVGMGERFLFVEGKTCSLVGESFRDFLGVVRV